MPLHLKQVWRAERSLWIEGLGVFVLPLLMAAQRCLSVCLLAAGSMLASVPTASGADVPPPQPAATRVSNKTLVAWVYLANTNQQGGSALTLIDQAEHFDAMVFGEIAPGRWMAGSDFFRRTPKDQAAWLAESGGSNTLVQLAIRYHSNRVTLFRNGREYAAYSIGQAQSFGDDATVLLGLRYIGEMGEIGFFAGAIEDARIYDRPMSGEQIAALRPNEPSDPRPLAWWSFDDGKAEDIMKTFPATRLEGNARVVNGKLILDGSSYYMMFSTGGLMVTHVADRPEGPFVAAKRNFCLLAGHTYFARFFPTPGGLLVNHHSIARDGQVFFGSLKAAGKIGLVGAGEDRAVTSLKAWRADAPSEAAAPSSSAFPAAPHSLKASVVTRK